MNSSTLTRSICFAVVMLLSGLAPLAFVRAAGPGDYDQWKLALGADAAVEPTELEVIEGFEVELVRSAGREEGSWISLEFDGQGRLIIAREDKGLLRITPPNEELGEVEPTVETINDTLEECRGLLYAHDSLYVNANNSRGFYRLRDTTDDDQYDEVQLLKQTGGGLGHGRNDIALGPDGDIYLIHGNDTLLPLGFTPGESPFRNYAEDKLLACSWDRLLFNAGVRAPAGHVVRTDRDGKKWEVVAGGFRNPYGLDFNADGELFTYDADMEWDVGAPWYRPTRVNHIISGADFGWRQGTGKWPEFYPDTMPAVVDLGLGSPTAVKFGTKSNFPPKYQQALFVLDWAYGRIFAVHLTSDGATYTGQAEVFVKGKPLNVTDLGFGPDGAMYFVTGGRKTQSGLYRVRYAPEDGAEEPPAPEADLLGELSRNTRREVERFHGRVDPDAIATVWEYLESPDRAIRHAARVAVEHQPIANWQDRALKDTEPTAAATALLALARVAPRTAQAPLLDKADELLAEELSTEQKLVVARALVLCFCRMGRPLGDGDKKIVARLEACYPDGSPEVNHLLCQLLVYLESPQVVANTLPLLAAAEKQEEKLHYLYTLRHVDAGWTPLQRTNYFQWLRRAREFEGAHYMPRFIEYIADDAAATLSADERVQLAALLAKDNADENSPIESRERAIVRKWSVDDLIDDLHSVGSGRDFEQGKNIFVVASCSRCHRMGKVGQPFGPDLQEVSRRFSRRDMLISLIEPSKVVPEKYQNAAIITEAGKVVVGRVLGDDGDKVLVATDPFDPKVVVEVARQSIETRQPSLVSPMPSSLLDILSREEILDLMAYIESGGNAESVHFGPALEPVEEPEPTESGDKATDERR